MIFFNLQGDIQEDLMYELRMFAHELEKEKSTMGYKMSELRKKMEIRDVQIIFFDLSAIKR